MAVPATQVASERLVSTAGNIISLGRENLLPEHAEQLGKSCDAEYIGLTTGSLRQRMNNYLSDTQDLDKPVPIHADTHNQDFQTCYTTKILKAFPKQFSTKTVGTGPSMDYQIKITTRPQQKLYKIYENCATHAGHAGLSIPTDPIDLSYWVAQNLPLSDEQRLTVLKLDSAIQRLRWELNALQKVAVARHAMQMNHSAVAQRYGMTD
ncbi:unnamed protein product [Timema podura]|uniref:Uncharacterized protein n=1 Tax=Timema podura TaxID=61482 RepID=A0ABN7NIV6_TIMPD|nr:unnamed protein product [Timema podura]